MGVCAWWGGSWKVEGRKQRQWKRRWNWGVVGEGGAKKGGSEGSSSKVRELKSPEQPLAPLPFMALVDNTYQSAVTGFCLHTQRGIPQCPGCFLCTAAKPRSREGSSASYSECVAVCYIWVPLKEWGRATHCLGLGVVLPPPEAQPDPASSSSSSCFSPSPNHVLKAEVQGEWPAREALHLAGLT